MLKLLSALFGIFDKLLSWWRDRGLVEQGRQQAVKEANDEINRQVDLAEHVAAAFDPERDERLRNRFDRSRSQ